MRCLRSCPFVSKRRATDAKQHDIDLIVMGTHGRGGVEKMWLGSVTDKVLRKAHCPVLAMRPSQVAV